MLDQKGQITDNRQSPPWGWALVLAMVLLFVAYYAPLAIRKYDALLVGRDLADASQAVWWTTQGKPLHMTTHPLLSNRLGLHVEPVLVLLAPLYALVPSAKTLILVQVLALALAAVPLYALAVQALARPILAIAFPLLFLLSPAIHNAALADFYPVTLGILPAMLALWAMARGRTRTALLFGGLTLLAREDYGLWLAGLALLGWVRTRQRVWIGAGLLGGAWFLTALFAITPAFSQSPDGQFWARYLFWLEGPEAWQTQGFLPEKVRYLGLLLLMGGAGALLAPLWFVPALPMLVTNLLSNFTLPVSLDSYYSVLIAPQLLAATAMGLRRFRLRWQGVALVLLLLAGLAIHLVQGRSPLVPGFRPPQAVASALPAILAELPPDAPVCASPNLAPHVSNRAWLRVLPNRAHCDWILLDIAGDRSRHPTRLYNLVHTLLDEGWGIHSGQDGLLLLSSAAPNATIPDGFYDDFARAVRPPQHPTQIVFDWGWKMIGYDLTWDYWGRPQVRLHWQVLGSPAVNIQPALLAIGPEGKLIATPDSHLPVSLLWMPTSSWEPGHTYIVETLPFDAPDQFELFTGVGGPLVDPSTRLHTEDGRDLVSLATLERHGRGWTIYPSRED